MPQEQSQEQILLDARKKGWFWDFNDVFNSDLSVHAKIVRLYLACCADNATRQAWPSYNKISKDCRISRETAKRAIKELEEKKWIKKIKRKKDNNEYLTNVYLLCDPPNLNQNDNCRGRLTQSLPLPFQDRVGSESAQVGSERAQVGTVSTQVGSERASNNTQKTIPSYKDKLDSKLYVSSLRSDTYNNGLAFQSSPVAVSSDNSNNDANNRDSHPQAGVADTSNIVNNGNGKKNNSSVPNNKELIAELVEEYRTIEGITPTKGDYSFVGALYNEFGYDMVLEGINKLSMAMATNSIGKPLIYLRGILNNLRSEHAYKNGNGEGTRKKKKYKMYLDPKNLADSETLPDF